MKICALIFHKWFPFIFGEIILYYIAIDVEIHVRNDLESKLVVRRLTFKDLEAYLSLGIDPCSVGIDPLFLSKYMNVTG